MTHLGDYFRAKRLERGLTLANLARLTGRVNTWKTMRKIGRFESGGTIGDELLAILADVLDVAPETVEELLEKDRGQTGNDVATSGESPG